MNFFGRKQNIKPMVSNIITTTTKIQKILDHTSGNSIAITPYATRREQKRTGRTQGLPAEANKGNTSNCVLTAITSP